MIFCCSEILNKKRFLTRGTTPRKPNPEAKEYKRITLTCGMSLHYESRSKEESVELVQDMSCMNPIENQNLNLLVGPIGNLQFYSPK